MRLIYYLYNNSVLIIFFESTIVITFCVIWDESHKRIEFYTLITRLLDSRHSFQTSILTNIAMHFICYYLTNILVVFSTNSSFIV